MFEGANCTEPQCVGCGFDTKEESFAQQIGTYLSNFASSGDPNQRRADDGTPGGGPLVTGAGPHGAGALVEWPAYNAQSDRNLVMEPTLTRKVPPAYSAGYTEEAIGRKQICDLWNAMPGK